MKNKFFILCLMCCSTFSFGQRSLVSISKPIIDSAAINHWPSLGQQRAISNDGRYFMYSIDNQPVGSNTLIIRSTESAWQREFVGIGTGVFSGDSKEFVFQNADTLFFLSLGKEEKLKKITGVASYGQPANGKGRWLAYQLSNEKRELIIHDFINNQDRHFDHVTGYMFDDAMTKILIKTINGLEWAGLKDGKISQIWSLNDHPGSTLGGSTIDKKGAQLSFMTTKKEDGIDVHSIWYYREGMTQTEEKVRDGSPGLDPDAKLASSFMFSDDGQMISFDVIKKAQILKPSPDAVSVDVWSWQDSVLQSAQLANPSSPTWHFASIDIKNGKIIQLNQGNEQLFAKQPSGSYVVVTKTNNPGDKFWLDRPDSVFLVSVKDGSRTSLNIIKVSGEYHFSPDGSYLVYYDAGQRGNFFSIDLVTKQIRKISAGIPDRWFASDLGGFGCLQGNNLPDTPNYGSFDIVGWEPFDNALLVYDSYDIWKLSLTGMAPINVTKGYGRKHHIRFRVFDDKKNHGNRLYKQSDSLLLVAYNTENKYNGFYRLRLLGKSDPRMLSMGPWMIWHAEGVIFSGIENFEQTWTPPAKALDANLWVIERSTATDAPNFYLTKDFKNYKPLTDLQPQKKYNWLTSELVSWVQPDDITTQGVLYKPEDFDPNKKYPVIIQYYEQMAHRMYEFPPPEYATGNINIPWFVSRGYLVFTPDIYYHKNAMTQSACTTVESAGKMLARLPYVDSLRMGIAGHSWGGTETNYIVTHTHMFAAALSGAGGEQAVDLISNSLAMQDNGGGPYNDLGRYEEEVGATLWQRPDLWIKKSPIFQADKVTTPFLIFANKGDGGATYLRALELFIALRRLEKPTWMLQYDNGGHRVDGKDAKDFTIRATQFFDHYLKDAPMPVWMSRGIPARLKGVDNGLGFDTENSQAVLNPDNNLKN